MKHSILDDIEIASPCSANWDEMTGSERARFCAQCSKNVYNILDMTKQEAEALIFETEGEVCVRLFRRKDGTVITDDCPVGLRVVRACYKKVAAWITTIIGALTSVMPCIADQEKKEPDKTLPRIEIQSHSRAMGTTNFFKVTLERRILEALNALPQGELPREVTVEIVLYKDGRLPECKVISSSGSHKFDAATVNAVIDAVKELELPEWYKGESLKFNYDLGVNAKKRPLQAKPVAHNDCPESAQKQSEKSEAKH